jgi:hypothetical protein
VKSRTGWILAGTIAIVLLSGTAAYPQQADANSSAAEASTSSDTSAGTESASSPASIPALTQRRIDMYDLAMGPLFVLAWVLFAAGFAWRILLFRRLTRPARAAIASLPVPSRNDSSGTVSEDIAFLTRGMSGVGKLFFRIRRQIRRTVFGTSPVMSGVSLAFHLCLFLVPLLLPAHNILSDRSIGVSLPTLPEPLADKLTLGLLAFGAFFLLRRILFPRVRALSTLRDYLVLLLVAAPFVTAYMAYHHWLDYRIVLVTHMIVGEILIAAIPFTKLGHMPFLIFARFFMSSEYAWRPANRRW